MVERATVGIARVRALLVTLAIAALLAGYGAPAAACCCTCANSVTCFPGCFPDTQDRASCEGACADAGCGNIAACPDPSGGAGCAPGEVSCFDLAPAGTEPAPALTTDGLFAAALVLTGVGFLMLRRTRS